MKTSPISISILLTMMVLFHASALGAERDFQIAMIMWRGETEAERGFMDGLKKARLKIAFQKYNACQDLVRLNSIIGRIEFVPIDLIYCFGTTTAKAVLSRVKDRPVVFNIVNRPVASGIIASWKNSCNNATGASNQVPVVHQLGALKKIVDFKTLGIVFNPKEHQSIVQRDVTRSLEKLFKFRLREYHIQSRTDIQKVLQRLEGKVDAVYFPADSMTKSCGKVIMGMINSYNIPSLAAIGSMVIEDGALLGLVPSYYQLGRLAADNAVFILQGEDPANIPTRTLDHFHMLINMKTAQKIGVQIPMSILVMANKIVR